MAKKRKSDATRLEEVDRCIYTSFCSAANSLSQLYSHFMNQQKLSFQAGERHALEKLYDWTLKQQGGSRVNTIDIVAYLQNELEYGLEEPPMSTLLPFQHQHPQPATHLTNTTCFPVSSSSLGPTTAGQGPRSGHSDHQPKNSVFSNALSGSILRSLQQYHLSQGGGHPSGHGCRNSENKPSHHQIQDSNVSGPNDSVMDMHADSPGRESSY